MYNNPLVSIIVPVYNAEKYLSECLDCLVNQTYKNLEIICINDGSKDNSLQILEDYQTKDNRIKVYSQDNQGEAATRNRGLELAAGDYITALDSDDTFSLNTVESSINLLYEQSSDIVINFLDIRRGLREKHAKDFSYTAVWQLFYKKILLLNASDIKYNNKVKMGPDVIYTHKILGLTDKISKNYVSSYYYRQHDNQVSFYMNHNPNEYFSSILEWFNDLITFYDKHNWWESHNVHIINFLCEQPFTQYLRLDLNKQQKEQLFDKIHNLVKEKNLKIDFNYSNKRVKMFKIFINCENYKQFELYWFFAHLYLKYIDFKKRYINTNSLKIMRENV